MAAEVLLRNNNLLLGHLKFTLQSKYEIYTNFDNALFRDPKDPLRISYPADHALVGKLEDEITAILRGYERGGEYLSPHRLSEHGAKVDAPDSTVLMLHAAAGVEHSRIPFH